MNILLGYDSDLPTDNVHISADIYHPSLPDIFESIEFYNQMYRLTFIPAMWAIDTAIQGIAYGEFQTNVLRDFV